MSILQTFTIRLLLFFLGLIPILAQGSLGPVIGFWQNPTPINKTGPCFLDSFSSLFLSDNSDNSDTIHVEYDSSDSYYNIGTHLSLISTDPLTWQSSDQKQTVSYVTSSANSFGTLIASYNDNTSSCSYSYQKNTTSPTLSGTWTWDPINDEIDESTVPTTLTVTDYGLYMNISVTYSNSTTQSGFFYWSPELFYEGLGYTWWYNPTLSTFYTQTLDVENALYSQNGSCAEAFLGNWTDPQDSSDSSDEVPHQCCVPYSIQIENTGSNYPQQLSVKLFFNETILSLPNCSVLKLYEEESDFVPLTFSSEIGFPNEVSYSISNSDLGRYSFAMASPNELSFVIGNDNPNCWFTLHQDSPNPNPNPNPNPKPKFSDLLSIKMITLVYLLFFFSHGL